MGPAYPASRRVIAVRPPPCPPPMMTTCLFASALFMAASRGRIWLISLHFDNTTVMRSEEHTSELQSRGHLVCRLLLEKKKKNMQLKLTEIKHTDGKKLKANDCND